MNKFTRGQRISAITKILVENPNKIIGLNYFTDLLNAAKSTTSEDIVIIRDILNTLSLGNVETISGAAGGVKYVCTVSDELKRSFSNQLCETLRSSERIIPGNFLYMTDILSNPEIIRVAGLILASGFIYEDVDYVVTVETKGIPLAYEVAKMLGVQLVIVRRDTKVTEGTTVSINYVTGSNKRIQSMSLSKRSLKKGSKCIFIDDFMKAGGTANGIYELLKEFECTLLGIGVLIDNVENVEKDKKLVVSHTSIIKYHGIRDEGIVLVNPSENIIE